MLRTVLHHLLQELHDDLGRRTDQHLALAALLGIEDAAKAVVQHRDAHHPEAGEESWSELWEAASEAKGRAACGTACATAQGEKKGRDIAEKDASLGVLNRAACARECWIRFFSGGHFQSQ